MRSGILENLWLVRRSCCTGSIRSILKGTSSCTLRPLYVFFDSAKKDSKDIPNKKCVGQQFLANALFVALFLPQCFLAGFP
jgi:hypothetical protein